MGTVESSSNDKFSRRQLLVIIIVGCSNLFSGCVISVLAPFYPEEALLKGASPTEVGFVFGIFHVVMIFASPICGSLLGRIQPVHMFNVGIFSYGTCAIIFGFLGYLDDRVTFIALSILLRIIQSISQSGSCAAAITLITIEFPGKFTTIFAALETTWGCGFIIGPTLGGILYELGGFPLPFIVSGSLVLFASFVSFCFLPKSDSESKSKSESRSSNSGEENSSIESQIAEDSVVKSFSKGFGFLQLVKVPGVVLAVTAVGVSSCSIGFLQATLEPFLHDTFGLTPLYIGLIFMIDGITYCVSAPLWGWICDKGLAKPQWIILVGCILTFFGFLFIGPCPGMPLEPILWLSIMGLSFHGVGVGASFVAGFIQGLQESMKGGFPDSQETYGLVSGLWLSLLAFGGFVGPIVGGILIDYVSFQLSTIFVLVLQIIMAAWIILFIIQTPTSQSKTKITNGADTNTDPDVTTPLLAGSR